MLVINLNFSYPTRLAYSWWPDLLFRVYVGGIHKAKVLYTRPSVSIHSTCLG